MRQSLLFTKTRKEAPHDEVARNADLLIRAGYIHKEMAGVYSYLPLGVRVLRKIENIIREEMNAIGGVELHLSALQNPDIWEATGRFNDAEVDNWFKTRLRGDPARELGLGFTHEEPITALMRHHVSSYRDLPVYAYQIQAKFRNEERAKSGIMRGREFVMKDLYSFHASEEDLGAFYEKVKDAYRRIFDRAGIGDRTFVTFASGGVFSTYSHEFQTLCGAGEDVIYLSRDKKIAVNKEVFSDDVLADLGLQRGDVTEEKAVEVGNIFKLGTRFSEPLGLTFADERGEKKPVVMGSYGIGLGRLMGVIVETLADERGIVWPRSVAPFDAHVLALARDEGKGIHTAAEELSALLSRAGVSVLSDDRPGTPGEKFADADLIGIPYRIVVSEKTLAAGKVEVRERATGVVEMVAEKELVARIKNHEA